MKRPLTTAGITLFFMFLLLGIFPDTVFLLCFEFTLSIAFIVSLCIKKIRRDMTLPTVLAVAVIACLLFLSFENTYHHTLSFAGGRHKIEATVSEYPEFKKEYGRFYCVAEISTIDEKKVQGKIRISFSETKDEIDSKALKPGQKISFDGYVYKIGQDITNIVQYFKSQGIYLGTYTVRDLQIEESKIKPITYYSGILKQSIGKRLFFDFDADVAGILFSVITGSKEYLKDDVYEKFQLSGCAHIMAVSGLHLSIAVILMKMLLEKLGKIHPIIISIVLLFLVLFIMTLADFSGSVKRAGIMMSLYIISGCFSSRSDPLNNLGFAATVILLLNPYAAFDISFILSFLATLSIICIAAPMIDLIQLKYAFFRGIIMDMMLSSVVISLSVMILTSSVTAVYFGNVCLIAPITNLFVVPAVPFIICFAVLHLIFGSINIVSLVTVPLCNVFSYYALFIADILSRQKYAYIPIENSKQAYIVVLVFSVMSAFALTTTRILTKRSKKYRP